MGYFDDLTFLMAREMSDCRVHVDMCFPDMYSLEFVLSGAMYFGVNGGLRTVIDVPAAHWHHPSSTYQYGPQEESWHHLYVTFRGARGKRILQEGIHPLSASGYLPVRDVIRFVETFRRLIRIVQEGGTERHAEGVVLLEDLVAQLQMSARAAQTHSTHQGRLARAVESIQLSPFGRHDVDAWAADVGVSVSHFRRLFQAQTGRSFHDFVLHTRMQQAARQLQEGSRQIKDVALAAGYADPAQFSKLFKQKIGVSPAQFRAILLTQP